MANLAIIPARGGSKRIPRKNVRHFLGKPIIAYSIEAAFSSGLFEEVMVSTDDEEIAVIAKQFGAGVPFMRSKKNADDFADTEDVLLEVLGQYETARDFSNVCCLYPTAPFTTAASLIRGYNKMLEADYDTLFPVLRFGFPVLRALKVVNNRVVPAWPEYSNYRSQDLETYYHDAGQFYWFNRERFLKNKILYSANSGFLELDELQVQDIDTLTDWQIAEFKYSFLQNNKFDGQ